MLAGLLLAGSLAALWWFIKGDLAGYRALRSMGDTGSRRARYLLWVAKALLAFALPALGSLALIGRLEALARLPIEFAPLRATIGPIDFGDPFLLGVAAGGLIGGIAIGTLWTIRSRRGGGRGPTLGNIGSLLPRNRGELPYVAALSLSAGVTEELFFRLLLPLLFVSLFGDALAGFVLATLLFGSAHRYQGWIGMVTTTGAGALFAAFYLATGYLWAAMLLHALIDLNGLVLRPMLTGMLARDRLKGRRSS